MQGFGVPKCRWRRGFRATRVFGNANFNLQVSIGLVRRGPIEVVDHAMDTWLAQMRADLTSDEMKEQLREMRVRQRVQFGIRTRLELVLPY